MNRILKYLRSEGGWISGAMMLGSMIANGVMGSQSKKRAAKLSHKTGEEQNFQDFLGANSPYEGTSLVDQANTVQGGLKEGMDAARAGGLFPAISEAFSQKPNSSEYDAIARQEKNLKNQALNTGARGGLLKQQMFEAAKNAATNKLGVMENARQNALQRAFQTFLPMAPNQSANAALNQQQLQGLGSEAQLGVTRNQMALGGANADAQGTGSGLGSMLGGLGGGGGGLSGLLGMFSPNATQAGGAIGPSMENGSFLSGAGSVMSSWFSDRNMKENITPVGSADAIDALDDMKIYLFNYKGDEKRHIGPMVQEAPAIMTDGNMISGQDAVGFLFAVVKGLSEKIKRLESNAAQIS